MANFTEDIYNRLVPHERTLRTAYYANYVLSVPSFVGKELTDIYNEIYNTDRKWLNCSRCLLDLAKRIGEHYFAYQTELGMHPEEVDVVVKTFNRSVQQKAEQQKEEQPKPVEKKPAPKKKSTPKKKKGTK